MTNQHNNQREEWALARKLHEWYLEATQSLDPENYNPNAQKSFDELNDQQREIDLYIAKKILQNSISMPTELTESALSHAVDSLKYHERQKVLDEVQAILDWKCGEDYPNTEDCYCDSGRLTRLENWLDNKRNEQV